MSDFTFTAVDVLIKRMETTPEDFLRTGQLYFVSEAVHEMALSPKFESKRFWFLKDAEKVQLIAAYREYCRKKFQAELFRTLFSEKQFVSAPKMTSLTADDLALFERQRAKEKALAKEQAAALYRGNPAWNANPLMDGYPHGGVKG